MSANSEQNNTQEIDLSFLKKKTVGIFENIESSIYRFIKFLLKNSLIIIGIIVVGAVLGYFIDQKEGKSYKHEVVLVPNFGSSTYLYNKIDNLDLKGSPVSSVDIEPILDIYGFITSDWNNLEIAKYLSQNNIQINKYTPNSDVEKFYRYHLLTIKTKRKDEGGKIVDSLLTAFNNDPYFVERQKVEAENNKNLVKGLNENIVNIDKILEKFGEASIAKSDLNIEMNPDLNSLIINRKNTITDLNRLNLLELEQGKVIFPTSKLLNIKVKSFPKLISVPFALLGLFLIGVALRNFYRKQQKKELEEL